MQHRFTFRYVSLQRCNNHTICSAHYQALSVYFEQPEKFYFVGEGIILSVLLFGILPAL